MAASSDNVIMNTCEYTPVYFIENPIVNQARSFVITPTSSQNVEKPASDLKLFYENSGKLETNLNVTENNTKRISKKPESNVVGNNLKLASFLLPKTELKNEQCITPAQKPIITPVNNIILKPVYIANNVVGTPNPVTVPKLDVNSKIVKLKDLPNVVRAQNGKILPKIKPKENSTVNTNKQTSVQLIRIGDTYHSLNQLSNDQMKMVNNTLKKINDPQGSSQQPANEPPVSSTKYVYKVMSPRDIPNVGKNKIKQQKIEHQTVVVNAEIPVAEKPEDQKTQETKVTRSGRIVKLPTKCIIDESPNKPKRKHATTVEGAQCPSKSHRPHRRCGNHNLASLKHTDLFQCLLEIIKTGSNNLFLEQLEKFITKLKSNVSCLLSNTETGTPSIINEDVGRLLGVSPGKYNIDLNALNCKKDDNGHCSHNPPPPIPVAVIIPKLVEKNETKTSMPDLTEYLLINNNKCVIENTQSIIKTECKKQKIEQNQNDNVKKMKTSPETESDNVIDDLFAILSDTNADKTENKLNDPTDNVEATDKIENEMDTAPISAKPTHIQFRSTHFDIRSSPIKSTSTVFRKFQINPAKMAKYEVENIQPINKVAEDIEMTDETQNEQEESTNIIQQSNFNLQSSEVIKENSKMLEDTDAATYKTSEVWVEQSQFQQTSVINHTNDFLRTTDVIEPSLLHVHASDRAVLPENNTEGNDPNQGQIISFLECLGNDLYTDSVRNNSGDFQLDLFSYT